MDYKYVYRERDGKKSIVNTITQLSELSGMNSRDISRNLKQSDLYCHRQGLFTIEKIEYVKNKLKSRNKVV